MIEFFYMIHDDVIDHQTTGHYTSRIIITYILIFHWEYKMIFFQSNFLKEVKKLFEVVKMSLTSSFLNVDVLPIYKDFR